MSYLLGISAFYHDSAAALLHDGEIVAAAQEERFSRKKHDPAFPHQAVSYCLEEGGVSLDELDAVVFYDKPFLKFERLLETYYAFAPRGLRSFLTAMPVWIKEKLLLKRLILEELGGVEIVRYPCRSRRRLHCRRTGLPCPGLPTRRAPSIRRPSPRRRW